MVGNSEKIRDLNTAELFATMIRELPWRVFNSYITGNAQLLKLCTMGGNRVEPQKRQRLEQQVLKDAERNEYSEVTCNAVFAVWYPVHEAIHQNLEDYFKSDEYKAYRTEKKLTEEDYVLPDEKFDAFFKVQDIKAWSILLAFSPLKFTDEQADKILGSHTDAAGLVDQVKTLQAQLADAERKAASATAEAERLRAASQNDARELQELKKSQRAIKADFDALQAKYASSAAETKRLASQLAEVGQNARKESQEATENAERATQRLQANLQAAQEELRNWQNRFQEQLQQNRQISANADQVAKRSATVEVERDKALQKLGESQKFVDLLLSRIEWAKLGAQLKLTPTIRRNFNSLIKRLNYEEDLSLTIEGTLPEFWKRISASETTLIDRIAQSSTLEAQNGDMNAFWGEIKDAFEDVQISLEARLFMVGFLHELLFSVYTGEQLETPSIPAAPKK